MSQGRSFFVGCAPTRRLHTIHHCPQLGAVTPLLTLPNAAPSHHVAATTPNPPRVWIVMFLVESSWTIESAVVIAAVFGSFLLAETVFEVSGVLTVVTL